MFKCIERYLKTIRAPREISTWFSNLSQSEMQFARQWLTARHPAAMNMARKPESSSRRLNPKMCNSNVWTGTGGWEKSKCMLPTQNKDRLLDRLGGKLHVRVFNELACRKQGLARAWQGGFKLQNRQRETLSSVCPRWYNLSTMAPSLLRKS